MKIRFLIIICLICIPLIPANSIQGLPVFLDCTYDSDFVISANKLEFVPDETFVLNVKTVQNDDVFEVVIIDPKGKEVFEDTIDVYDNYYAQTRFHIPENALKGTWSVFITASPSHKQEVIFIGVDETPQSTLSIKPSFVNHKYKIDDASFLLAGKPDTDIQVNVLDPNDEMIRVYIVTLTLEGKCNFILDLDEYKSGVYTVEVSDHIDDATAVFTVGLQPTRGVIDIRTSSNSYFSGDKVLVLGDTAPDTHVLFEIFDPFENIANSFSVTSDKNGAISSSFYLSSDATEGTWKVKAISSPNFDSIEFDVMSESLTGQHESPIPEPDDNPHLETESFCGEGTTYIEGICVVDTTENPPNHSSHSWGDSPHVYDVESPLKQFKHGIPIDEIQCNENLVLLQKYDDSPVCVTESTKQKLIQRNWVGITNMLSSKYSALSDVEKLLTENQINYLPDKLVVTTGSSLHGDPGCGAVVDTDSVVHWFGIDSISNPSRMTLFSENPNQCKVNTSSCLCNAQIKLTALTLEELDYFTTQEQEKYANILIDYLYNENINRTPKFQIGKLNINYTDSSAIGYCGAIWGTNTYGFFDGAIVNNVVQDYGISKELPLLCAISDDAKWWINEN